MSPLQCPYCDHLNPNDAAFCNACGCRLHLKLCNQCEAVNDQDVTSCYQCGAELPVLSTEREAAARAACARLQQLIRTDPRASVAAPEAETASATGSGLWQELVPVAESFESRHGIGPQTSVMLMPRSEDAVIMLDPVNRDSNQTIKVAAILSAALLFAIAGSAYYVYRHPEQYSGWWQSAQRPSSAEPVDLKAAGPSVRLTAERDVAAPTIEPPPAFGAAGISAIEILRFGSEGESSNDAATSPVDQTGPRATRSDGLEGQVPMSSRSTRAGSATVQSQSREGGTKVPPASPRPIVCTEAIAAIALCDLSSGEWSK
jgi:hypothetical protein